MFRLFQVTLLLASNLPPNNFEKNAFRNSFHFEHKRNVLFVRKERLESIGELTSHPRNLMLPVHQRMT